MRMLDIAFLKTKPNLPQNSKTKNSKFPQSSFQKTDFGGLGTVSRVSHLQFIFQHDRINSECIFVHGASLHF